MSKIGIIYSFHTKNTSKIADMIADKLSNYDVEKLNIEEATAEDFVKFDFYILGSATWFEGELPNHWDEFLPSIEDTDFSNKKIALFGLGDQIKYPLFFGDALGRLVDFFEPKGAKLVGLFPTKDFTFDESYALRGNKFVGLMLDFENQENKNEERIDKWIKTLKKEL